MKRCVYIFGVAFGCFHAANNTPKKWLSRQADIVIQTLTGKLGAHNMSQKHLLIRRNTNT